MPKGQFTPYTKAQKKLIVDNYLTTPVKQLAQLTNSSFGRVSRFLKAHNLVIPKEVKEARKRATMFNKGHVAHNKGKKQTEFMSPEMIERTKATRFKKGQKPHNYKTGEFLSKDGYVVLSIGDGKQKLKHIYNWEQVNGKLPKGYCLACVDGNKTNTHHTNWELITREENMLRNSHLNIPKPLVRTMALTSKLKKTIAKLESNE
ncbi:HNH endonuclease signature motif containing protein [Cellulophaga lytica]|uniref:HNH endonuclease signature motif containing protein n=1 Tax=Cellulophaga lytica TaxID=979 RepID=UPI003CE4D861